MQALDKWLSLKRVVRNLGMEGEKPESLKHGTRKAGIFKPGTRKAGTLKRGTRKAGIFKTRNEKSRNF